jgi:hypothetical protein
LLNFFFWSFDSGLSCSFLFLIFAPVHNDEKYYGNQKKAVGGVKIIYNMTEPEYILPDEN